MTLAQNLPLFMPLSPNPPVDEIQKISDALEVAMTATIRTSFVPLIGTVFLSNLTIPPTPFLLALGAYLDASVSPIISAALAAQATAGGPIGAWLLVQPSFDAITPLAPPFMAGIFGALFWAAIIFTIRLAILPPIPDVSGSSTESTDFSGRDPVLRVDE